MKNNTQKPDIKDEEIDQYDFIDFDNENKIINKFSKVIGEFLIYFNNLEHELNLALSYYFADDLVHQGYLITKNIMFRNKVDLFNDLYSVKISFSKKQKLAFKKLKTLYKDLDDINTFRNNVIHANWLTLDKENYVRTRIVVDSDGRVVKGKKIKITPGIIKKNIKKIELIIWKLDEIQRYINI